MSLFPAYAQDVKNNQNNTEDEKRDWLNLGSFPGVQAGDAEVLSKDSPVNEETQQEEVVTADSSNSEESSSEEERFKQKKHKKKKKKKHSSKRKHRDDSPISSEHHRKKHKKKEKEKKDRKHEKCDARLPDKPSVDLSLHKKKVFIDEISGLKPEFAFRIDRQKDENNLIYGSLYQKHIARHRNITDFCIGSNIRLGEKLSKHFKTVRYFDKLKVQLAQTDSETILPQPETDSKLGIPDDNEIKFETATAHQILDSDSNPLGVYDKSTALWNQGKGLMQEEVVDENYKHFRDDPLQKKSEDYNCRLAENPHDTQLWLEYVAFQDKLEEKLKNESNTVSVASSQVINQNKMAIVEKALEKNPASVELKLAQLELGADLWEPEAVLEKWKNFTFYNINNVDVWRQFLAFRQGRFSAYKVDSAMKAYAKCLSSLETVARGEMKSHPAKPYTVETILDLMFGVMEHLKLSGQSEKSIAFFQCLLEFNLHRPAVLETVARSDQVDFLEAFWEGSCPRFGEDDAPGWAAWVNSKGNVEPVVPWNNKEEDERLEEDVINTSSTIPEAWSRLEKLRCTRQCLPWRPNLNEGETEDDCEDPERIVLCRDLSPCLVLVSDDYHKFLLICGGLEQLGIHIQFDKFSPKSCSVDSVFKFPVFNNLPLAKAMWNYLIACYGTTKLIRNIFLQSIELLKQPYSGALTSLHLQFLYSCLSSKDVKEIGQKELQQNVKQVMSKTENRNNTSLYIEMAQGEVKLGNLQKALKILEATVNSQPVNISKADVDLVEINVKLKLYAVYAELLVGLEDAAHALVKTHKEFVVLDVLCAVTSDLTLKPAGACKHKPSAATLLRTKKYLVQTLEAAVGNCETQMQNQTDGDWSEQLVDLYVNACPVVHLVSCLVMFLWFSESQLAAMAKFEELLQKMKFCMNSELDKQYSAKHHYFMEVYKLLVHKFIMFARHWVFFSNLPTKHLQKAVMIALDLFPRDYFILSVFAELQTHSGLIRDFRKHMDTLTVGCQDAGIWLISVLTELCRKQKLTHWAEESGVSTSSGASFGIMHRIRSSLERGLQNCTRQHQWYIWKMYLLFELQEGHMDKARNVFFRAVQQCPYVKDIYVSMAQRAPELLTEITDYMTEKELRLRTPLEEVELLMKSKNIDESEMVTEDNLENVQVKVSEDNAVKDEQQL